jgi:hypothetical protein
MISNFYEVYNDIEKAIDYAFNGQFVLKFYDYLRVRETKKKEVEQFLTSSTLLNVKELVLELEEYIEGGSDNSHKQLREAYGHISKPDARKIRNYLYNILQDAERYNHDKRRGRRKKQTK